MIKYFPFAPYFPYKIRSNRFIMPPIHTMNSNIWEKISDNKNIIITAYGGLIESFLSLYYLETFNPRDNLFWAGNEKYNQLVYFNGLAKVYNKNIENLTNDYPSAIFTDNENNLYLNALNNYIKVKPFITSNKYTIDKHPIFQQIVQNSIYKFDKNLLPKIRKHIEPYKTKRPYICIFPDIATGWSQLDPKFSFLNFDYNQINWLIVQLYKQGIDTIVFKKHAPYYGVPYKREDLNIENVFKYLPNSKAILSNEIDFLLLGLIISKAKLIYKPRTKKMKHYDLVQNAKFIEAQNKIVSIKNITEDSVYQSIIMND